MKRIDTLIKDNDTLLDHYVHIAKQLMVLDGHLKTALPSILTSHCQIANYQGGCLSIQVANAAWAFQLRYLIPDIQKKLQAIPQFHELHTIRYFVAPGMATKPIARCSTKIPLSTESAQLIRDTAKHIPGELGKALCRLAAHAKETP